MGKGRDEAESSAEVILVPDPSWWVSLYPIVNLGSDVPLGHLALLELTFPFLMAKGLLISAYFHDNMDNIFPQPGFILPHQQYLKFSP